MRWCTTRDPSLGSGGDGFEVGHLLSGGVGVGHGLALGQEVESEVAAAFGPLVVLLGEDGADQADDRWAVGEDADHVGAAADLAVEPLVGVVGPDLAPDLPGER